MSLYTFRGKYNSMSLNILSRFFIIQMLISTDSFVVSTLDLLGKMQHPRSSFEDGTMVEQMEAEEISVGWTG